MSSEFTTAVDNAIINRIDDVKKNSRIRLTVKLLIDKDPVEAKEHFSQILEIERFYNISEIKYCFFTVKASFKELCDYEPIWGNDVIVLFSPLSEDSTPTGLSYRKLLQKFMEEAIEYDE